MHYVAEWVLSFHYTLLGELMSISSVCRMAKAVSKCPFKQARCRHERPFLREGGREGGREGMREGGHMIHMISFQ